MSKPEPTLLPEHSLNRQVVLEEDEYTEALSKIIARDFFPSLTHLDATNDYLDAISSRDPHLIQASVRRLGELNGTPLPSTNRGSMYQTPSATPWAFSPSDTPSRTPGGEAPLKRLKYDTDMSLDSFQARYTSEDNSSFTRLLDEENRVRKEKYGWAWEAQKRVEAQQQRMVEARERMLIEPPPVTGVKEKFAIDIPKPAGLLTAHGEHEYQHEDEESGEIVVNKGQKMGELPGEEEDRLDLSGEKGNTSLVKHAEEGQTDVMAPKKDTRSAGVDGWKFKTRNSLMFSPDADTSPYDAPLVHLESEAKLVKYSNTRLPEQDHSTSASRSISTPPSPTRSRVEAAITGTPYYPKSGNEDGFSLIPNLPSPTPAELGPTAMKQLMTWGTLNSTPRIISHSDDPADAITSSSPFHLPEISSREAISHKLSNNASKSLRAKAGLMGFGQLGRTPGIRTPKTPLGRKGNMAPPSWTPKRADAPGSLTLAARRLLDRSTLRLAATRRAEAMERNTAWDNSAKGKERELRWTPTPG